VSLRIDTAELISGAYVIGETGLGVLGSNIPSTGLYGASYLYNDLSLPADANKEIRGLIVTPPSAGAFFAYEDGSFSLIGAPDGAYTFVYRLFVDGVDLGTTTATTTIGSTSTSTLAGGATLSDMTASGGISSFAPGASDLSGAATMGDVAASGGMAGYSAFVTANPHVWHEAQRPRVWHEPVQ
jgi:hypothetical protein